MKKFVVFYLATLFVLILGELTEEQKKQYEQSEQKCIGESGINKDVVDKVKAGGKLEETKEAKEFFFCLFKDLGFIEENGEIQVDMVQLVLSLIYNDEMANDLVEKCAQEHKSNGLETSFHLGKCLIENAPPLTNM